MKTTLPSEITLTLPNAPGFVQKALQYMYSNMQALIAIILSAISVYYFFMYLNNGLGLSYNDARSHLDIGRRVVEGLKPGLAQLGSVWLPLQHLLMVPLIWNDWMWHSGFAGAVWNMISFVGTGLVINALLTRLRVGVVGRLTGVFVFAANLNILYLQSTAMTELLLLFTMTMGCYYLLIWHTEDTILDLIKSAFWIMLATLVRYDGWFLLGLSGLLVMRQVWIRHAKNDGWNVAWSRMEGITILFASLAALGVFGWFAWNQLIFGDALYFALGPFSAHAQQLVMEEAGALPTKYNFWLSLKVYFYALLYNSYTLPALLATIGAIVLWRDRTLAQFTSWGMLALLAPLLFNVLALFLGFSVIYVQGISGDTWFNIRYGVMLAPTIAILIGYLVDRAHAFRLLTIGSLLFVLFFAFANEDSVSIDDARVGSSQKNVSEVSGYLNTHASREKGFILISAASHDAIIFSSGLPMKRFIHEGTGLYWENALALPDRWAKWIVMRTYDDNDLTWKGVSKSSGFQYYNKVAAYPFADVYELQASMSGQLNTEPILGKQK
jgi:hypothetical protein